MNILMVAEFIKTVVVERMNLGCDRKEGQSKKTEGGSKLFQFL